MKPKLTRDERDLNHIKQDLFLYIYGHELDNYNANKFVDFIKLIDTIKFPSSTHLAEKKRYVDNLLKAFLIGIK